MPCKLTIFGYDAVQVRESPASCFCHRHALDCIDKKAILPLNGKKQSPARMPAPTSYPGGCMYQQTNDLAGGHVFASAQEMMDWLEKAMADNIRNNKDQYRFEADPYAYVVNYAAAAGLELDDAQLGDMQRRVAQWAEQHFAENMTEE